MPYTKLILFYSLMMIISVGSLVAQNKEGYKVGDKARDFSLKDVSGEMVSMASQSDAKGFLVIFSCNTCPYVVAYEDRMIELHKKYAPQGYPVIAINPNDKTLSPGDSFEKMQERANDKNFPFAYLYDETQEITRAYGATRTPEVYLLQRQGKEYMVKYIGAIDNNYREAGQANDKYVEDAMDAVLNNRQIAQTSTKAIGCTIKFRK
ncbi:thioredoxin family protein [Anditalea andensis]|uniref:Redoxin n=1 Tax=Anditalea andensis TaxID=1048983 RepID=A0A074KVE1_9BACT|nr:thioredoxin family protein [Anditalea andensis]KEO72195.1 redoxin [Anditalea andensis]